MTSMTMVRHRRSITPAFEVVEDRILCAGLALTVPGTANPYLADPTNSTGPVAATDGTTPPSTAITGFDRITFSVSGLTTYYPFDLTGLPRTSPDGGTTATSSYGARGGISAWSAPLSSLAGVFLAAKASVAPGPFTDDYSANEFRPQLGQVFFIGDGLTGTGTGVPQVFYVPKGAVRLFLVDIDGYEWADNGGSYSVEIMAAGKVPAAPLSLTLDRAQAELNEIVGYKVTGPVGVKTQLEIRPEGSSLWMVLPPDATAKSRFTVRRAGNTQVRASAVVEGQRVYSESVALSVFFPTGKEIAADKTARGLFEQAWQQSKNYAEHAHGFRDILGTYPRSRIREFGFWVVFDTATGKYSAARPKFGSVTFPPEATEVLTFVTPRPKDRIAKDGKSAVYVVGLFHTHPPATYSYSGHLAGPSPTDVETTHDQDVANLVYDYVAAANNPASGKYELVPAGHPVNAAALIYAGDDQRIQVIHS